MGSQFLMRCYEEYRDKYLAVNLLCPTVPDLLRQSGAPATLGIYNHILLFQNLIEMADLVYTVDNQAVYDICRKQKKVQQVN